MNLAAAHYDHDEEKLTRNLTEWLRTLLGSRSSMPFKMTLNTWHNTPEGQEFVAEIAGLCHEFVKDQAGLEESTRIRCNIEVFDCIQRILREDLELALDVERWYIAEQQLPVVLFICKESDMTNQIETGDALSNPFKKPVYNIVGMRERVEGEECIDLGDDEG